MRKKIILILVTLFLLPSVLYGDQGSWPLYRNDQYLSGYTATELSDSLILDWIFEADDAIGSSPVIIDNMVLFGCADGNLYSLNLHTGGVKWMFKQPYAFEAPPAIIDQHVYIGSVEGIMYCLNLADGSKVW